MAHDPGAPAREAGRQPRPSLRERARALKRDVVAIYLAARDPRVPWYAKAAALVVAGYALSPIDLIPDFIPVLGYLDDVLLVPAGIALVRRLIPPALLAEHRAAAEHIVARPTSRTAAAVIVLVWIAAIALSVRLAWPWVGPYVHTRRPTA